MEFPVSEIVLALALGVNGSSVDPKEAVCLARNIYHEARGESDRGQAAVAAVTMNRVEDLRWPDEICDVVYQERQFSWTNRDTGALPRDWSAYEKAMLIAIATISGDTPDPTKGAQYFHGTYIPTPPHARGMTVTAVIGDHEFRRDRR